jgi:carboxymethylenebutenolidase
MPDIGGSYLAEPPGASGSGAARVGVLVVHDWYGLLPHVRGACDELAAAGLVALAPDLYDGRTASDPEQAEALMEAMDSAKTGAIYYAALDPEDAAQIHCPVLLHLAEEDEFDPPEYFESFIAALKAGGTEVEVRTWPGTRHSFANRDVPLYAPAQADQAWSITVEFLGRHLGGGRRGG